jgi:hypothetical protein
VTYSRKPSISIALTSGGKNWSIPRHGADKSKVYLKCPVALHIEFELEENIGLLTDFQTRDCQGSDINAVRMAIPLSIRI